MKTRAPSLQVAVLLPLLAVSLATTGCTRKLDHTKVEASIRGELTSKGVTMKTIDCPVNRAFKAGDTFDCTGVDSDGEHLVFVVEQTNGSGSIKWNLDGLIINQKKIGDGIEAKVGKAADVVCPEKAVILKVNQSFSCDVIIDGKSRKVLITLVNKNGDVTWKI